MLTHVLSVPNSYHLASRVSRIKVLPGHQDTAPHPVTLLCCGSTARCISLQRELRHFFSTLPSTSRPWHAAPSIASLHQQNCSGLVPHQLHHLPSPKMRLEMHDEEGRFKPDEFPELPPTKSCAGTTEGAIL